MKHIIFLSLKYIRRQKLRTVLTFLCVTLSVFILCSFGAYIGSTLQTLLNQCKRVGGSYEASIDSWLGNVDDTEEALDIVKNHIVVSDYYITMRGNSSDILSNRLENDGKIKYFEFSDGKNLKRISKLTEFSYQGNSELMGEMYGGVYGTGNSFKTDSESGAIVPSWLEDSGYSVGDTIKFTLCPVAAEFDEDSQTVKDIRRKLMEENGTSIVRDDPEYSDIDNEERRNTYNGTLKNAFMYYNVDFDEVPLKNEEYGETVEFTIKIAGFEDNMIYNDSLSVIRSDTNDYFFKEFFEKNPSFNYNKYLGANIRINDNIDFDDGLMILYGALGFNEGNYYGDLPERNNELLFFEFKSVGSMVQMLPLILIIFVFIFFAWLFARFVIDNAFEISSQERSSQFAALRVMGASKTQIVTLVFTESLFYTVTAVPTGTAAAYIFCDMSFTSFRKIGFQDFEFKANQYFVMGGIILCIAAIFISAYTSAMWASRKLSPAEALNFGKPKKKNKKPHRRKSKINLNSKQFLRRYTNKNIMRNKSRYIIATITMTMGVMLFTFSAMLGIYFHSEIKVIMENNNSYDFRLSFFSLDVIDDAEKSFRDEEIFSKAKIYAERSAEIDINRTPVKEFEKLYPYDVQLPDYFQITAVDRKYFDENIAELSGMTYDEFLQSGGGIYFMSSFGNLNLWQNDDKDLIPQYEEYYKPLETPISMRYLHDDYDVSIIGSICADFETYSGIMIPIDSSLTKNLRLISYIKVKVNGQENYEKAEAVYNRFIDEYHSWNYYNDYFTCTGLNEFVKAIIKIVITFIASIWFVGILSMVNSVNASVLNRNRELMMLRSIGMSRKQLRRTVVLESVMFSSFSSSVGIFLALLAYFGIMTMTKFEPVMLLSMSAGLIISVAVNIAIAVFAAIPGIRSLEKTKLLVRSF